MARHECETCVLSLLVSLPPTFPFSFSLSPLQCCSCCSFNNSKCRCFFTLLVPAHLAACLPAVAQHARTLRIRNVWHYVYATRQIQLSSWLQLRKADSVNAARHLAAFSLALPLPLLLSMPLNYSTILLQVPLVLWQQQNRLNYSKMHLWHAALSILSCIILLPYSANYFHFTFVQKIEKISHRQS